jgi:phage gp29-like protein
MSKKTPSAADPSVLQMRVIPAPSFMRFLSYMPNPDEVLRDTGEAIAIYREMKTDPRIRSLLAVAKGGSLNYPLRVEPRKAAAPVMEMVKSCLESLPLYNIQKRLLSGLEYGYSVVELVWGTRDGWWFPVDSVLRRPERFAFDSGGELKYFRQGELVDLSAQQYKWLIYRHDKDAENPYGTALLKSCYWPWKFKKAGAEFWLMATEKFSVASILALFESTEDEATIRKRAEQLSEMLSSMRSGSGAAIANIKDAKVIETSGDLESFKALCDWCDAQMGYAIVYQNLTTQESQMGTRAQATVHEDTFLQTVKGTCREMTPVLQRYIDWIVELNYGPDEPVPAVVFDLEDYASWKELCDAIDRSIPVSRTALYDRYGLPRPKDESDSFVKPEVSSSPLGFADDEKKKTRPLLIRSRKKN